MIEDTKTEDILREVWAWVNQFLSGGGEVDLGSDESWADPVERDEYRRVEAMVRSVVEE